MSRRTYVNNAQNRSLGRVGMTVGSMPVSRGSSGSSYGSSSSARTYVDNSYNRSLGRVGMEHGTAVASRSAGSSGSSSQRTYVDNGQNRSLGRVGMPVGSMPVSRGSSGSSCGSSVSSGSTKTYADNSYNRSLGRVGMPHGTAVVSKSHSTQNTLSSPSSSSSSKVYKDNAMNRRLGRVGKPLGSMPHSRSSSTKSSLSPKVYVDNSYNRALGRAGKPLGSMPVSKKSQQTETVRDLFQWFRNHPGEDFQVMETDNDEYTADLVMDLINRMNQVELWQEETGSRRQPQTATELLERYEGTIIQFEEINLGKKIGHGGFGDVHFAKWNGSVVAVKKLRVQRVSKKRLREFNDELQVFCRLEHKNIVKFIGACVVTPNLAIVMEYMQCSLHEAIHVEEHEFSGVERLSLIEQIMHGLKYLHGKQIAHCDLKSKNVLLDLTEDPVAKLTDFGLSMMRVESESSVSGAEFVHNIGTPRYSAPEVLRGQLLARNDMMKADMYSASLVVFEIIYEEEPFPRLKYAQLCEHVGRGTMTPDIPNELQISAPLEHCLKACWSRDADERPTAASFWSTIKSLPSLFKE